MRLYLLYLPSNLKTFFANNINFGGNNENIISFSLKIKEFSLRGFTFITAVMLCKVPFFIAAYQSWHKLQQNAICIGLTWYKSRKVCQLHHLQLIAKANNHEPNKSPFKKVSGGKFRINTTKFNYRLPLVNLSTISNIRIKKLLCY